MTFIAGGSNQNIGIMKMPIKTNNWDLETLWDQFRTNTGSPPLYSSFETLKKPCKQKIVLFEELGGKISK